MIYHVQQIWFVMYYKYDSSIKHTLFVLPNKYNLFCTTNRFVLYNKSFTVNMIFPYNQCDLFWSVQLIRFVLHNVNKYKVVG